MSILFLCIKLIILMYFVYFLPILINYCNGEHTFVNIVLMKLSALSFVEFYLNITCPYSIILSVHFYSDPSYFSITSTRLDNTTLFITWHLSKGLLTLLYLKVTDWLEGNVKWIEIIVYIFLNIDDDIFSLLFGIFNSIHKT